MNHVTQPECLIEKTYSTNWSQTLWSLLVLRRLNWVSIVMPCILGHNSMNMEQSSNSVAELPFSETETYIDSSSDKETDVAKKMEFVLNPPTFVVTSSGWTPTWFTNHSPFVVLDELKDLGFSVVAANTVGVTTVWTLQANMNVHSLRSPIWNDQFFNYARAMPHKYQGRS